jgi:hypothetical protein
MSDDTDTSLLHLMQDLQDNLPSGPNISPDSIFHFITLATHIKMTFYWYNLETTRVLKHHQLVLLQLLAQLDQWL